MTRHQWAIIKLLTPVCYYR